MLDIISIKMLIGVKTGSQINQQNFRQQLYLFPFDINCVLSVTSKLLREHVGPH